MKKTMLILLILAGCESDMDYPRRDHIVFGHFHGECGGETCIDIFKLTETALYEDQKDEYPSFDRPYDGRYRKLEDSEFEKVKDLWDQVPEELLADDSVVLGQPDAGDWGGIYFEMRSSGRIRYWIIDEKKENLRESLRPFVVTIEEKIQLLQ
jgi:hypothetical protein